MKDLEIDVQDTDYVYWQIKYLYPVEQEQTIAARFIITPHFDDIQFPSPFPIAENLPDMTHAEFLSALMTMAGLFAYPDSSDSNTIRMMSPDQFYNSTETIDYDYRTVGSEDDRTPNTQTDKRIVDSHLDATIQDWSRKSDSERSGAKSGGRRGDGVHDGGIMPRPTRSTTTTTRTPRC